jgi:heat shock protein HslJ
MKRIFTLISLSILLTYCGTPRKTNTGEDNRTARFNSGSAPTVKTTQPEAITIKGSEYVPVLGKNEQGMRPDLEGTWVMTSAAGNTGIERSASMIDSLVAADAKIRSMKDYRGNTKTTEVRRDSANNKVTTTTSTSTTTYLTKDIPEKKITPAQGSSMHNPERPSLSFYGSNETFTGFTGCNKISGRYTLTGNNQVNFQHSAPSTRMVCIGAYDEDAFLNTLRRINKFRSTSSQLELMDGEQVLFVFERR